MRIKNYYNKHLRSLFISKFTYSFIYKIVKLNTGILQLGFKKEKINYGLAYLFLFVTTLVPPLHTMKFNSIRGKKKLFFSNLSITLSANYVFTFLERLNFQYFPGLENWLGILHNFILKRKFFSFFYFKIEDFSIFYELDFLVKFNFSVLQSFLQKWNCRFYFKHSSTNSYELVTLLRSFEFPAES